MAIGSNNPFPSVLILEASAPSSPAGGNQRVYIDSADHKLKRKNSSGTVTIIDAIPTFSGARASRSTNLALTSGAETAITLPTEDYDVGGYFAANDSKVIIPAGAAANQYYSVKARLAYANSTAGTFRLLRVYFTPSGGAAALLTPDTQIPFHTNVGVGGVWVDDYKASAGDSFELRGYQDSGGSLNVAYATLVIHLIGA